MNLNWRRSVLITRMITLTLISKHLLQLLLAMLYTCSPILFKLATFSGLLKGTRVASEVMNCSKVRDPKQPNKALRESSKHRYRTDALLSHLLIMKSNRRPKSSRSPHKKFKRPNTSAFPPPSHLQFLFDSDSSHSSDYESGSDDGDHPVLQSSPSSPQASNVITTKERKAASQRRYYQRCAVAIFLLTMYLTITAI